MAIKYKELPVYAQKQRILDSLENNQVIIVQSPTGSGKTTQIPVILHEAGYSKKGIIGVTQPRRIAALSVSEFIAHQLNTSYPGLVGYKMRFDDKTDLSTKIKIMTDGILLQEMKLDPSMMKYSVIMVDEAHERSLNIDFVLGLLKHLMQFRKDLKIIVSSATMNAEAFSSYFNNCPIVTIDTITFPVSVVYDPPSITASTASLVAEEALLTKIAATIDRVIDNHEKGDILIFLPGEKVIHDCVTKLSTARFSRHLHLVPLYGRLQKAEQERVFDAAPFGKKKVVISTNIAETSVTIDGITTVIDTGLAKLNFYSPRTFTSSLIETQVSKASCNQRKGRAGRTQEGTCYRLYQRKDFDTRETYTTEEIFRTDLSEVVLRMAELGITDFEKFDFIAQPSKEGIRGAVETLHMLKALNSDNTLSPTGKMMVLFPLPPRVSKIIVESIMRYPEVLEEVLIASSFLSTHSPFLLPKGEEIEARKAHHAFRDIKGDFVSYVKLYRIYQKSSNKIKFCQNNYLDDRVMAEIENITLQLTQIVSAQEIPILHGGSMDDYLCCIASGMIQFVCIREGRENYRSLTADHISIHPGSNMFRADPLYIVAGEIVRTSRMFAMSVSPLTKAILAKIDVNLEKDLDKVRRKKSSPKDFADKKVEDSRRKNRKNEKNKPEKKLDLDTKNAVIIGDYSFEVKKVKNKNVVLFPIENLLKVSKLENIEKDLLPLINLRGKIKLEKNYTVLENEKLDIIFKVAKNLNLTPLEENEFNRKLNIKLSDENGKSVLFKELNNVMRITTAKTKTREMGFICLFTDCRGNYWFKISRGFSTALSESLSSLEFLIDDKTIEFTKAEKEKINSLYRLLHNLFSKD